MGELNHPRLVAAAESYEVRAEELEQAVKARDAKSLDALLLQVRDTAVHTQFGHYGKAVHNLSTLWYLMSHVYRGDRSDMEFGVAFKRAWGASGAGMEGGANVHSFQDFKQERRGRIVDNFQGHETEFKEQMLHVFPCSHDEFREWCQRGTDGYGVTLGGVGTADMSDHLADLTYGHHLRIKASAAMPYGADSDAGQVVKWAEDSKEMVNKTRPHFVAYATATLR